MKSPVSVKGIGTGVNSVYCCDNNYVGLQQRADAGGSVKHLDYRVENDSRFGFSYGGKEPWLLVDQGMIQSLNCSFVFM